MSGKPQVITSGQDNIISQWDYGDLPIYFFVVFKRNMGREVSCGENLKLLPAFAVKIAAVGRVSQGWIVFLD